MKKSLVLKLIVLAMLCYVAIVPSGSNAACKLSQCLQFDDGSPGCAEYESYNIYTMKCVMNWEQLPDGTFRNWCSVEAC
jgi:hypothetical protein